MSENVRTFTACICEDDVGSLNYISRHLRSEFASRGYNLKTDAYTTGDGLLEKWTSGDLPYDICFMDIDMPGRSGIEVCRQIRRRHADTPVVFISNKEDLVFQSFEVQPFRFIRKSHFDEELPSLVSAILRRFHELENTGIAVKELHSSRLINIDSRRVIYIEAMGKMCRMVLDGEPDVTFQYNLSDLKTSLAGEGFLHPHRSYLVNFRFIKSIRKDCVLLDNNETLPLSRLRAQEIRGQYLTLCNGGSL